MYLSRIQMRVNHFDDTEPGQPGMTRRSGPPWMFVSGWPFMAKTMRLFSSIAFLIGTPREIAILAVVGKAAVAAVMAGEHRG